MENIMMKMVPMERVRINTGIKKYTPIQIVLIFGLIF
jgi:hypothetical protein